MSTKVVRVPAVEEFEPSTSEASRVSIFRALVGSRTHAIIGATALTAGALTGTCSASASAGIKRAETRTAEDPSIHFLAATVSASFVNETAYLLTATDASFSDKTAADQLFDELDTSSQIRKLHELSGLTWEQISRMMGVSRRAVHSWASGARVNGANAERLSSLLSVVAGLDARTSAGRRALLFAPRDAKSSIFDEFRLSSRHGERVTEVLETSERLGYRS
jgi:transcriptional regulator with XRE-family HTH domain